MDETNRRVGTTNAAFCVAILVAVPESRNLLVFITFPVGPAEGVYKAGS
jgi:hypothetical protein